MRFLETFREGDFFRVAHPAQVSLNKRSMSRDDLFKVTKVYVMAPNFTISVKAAEPWDGFYSLGPRTPVLTPSEFFPSKDEILKFLGVKFRKRVVGYRLNWDGKTDIGPIISPQCLAIMRVLIANGQKEYRSRDLCEIFDRDFEKFFGREVRFPGRWYFYTNRRHLVSKGLIDEILDVRTIPAAIIDANLQEAFNDD